MLDRIGDWVPVNLWTLAEHGSKPVSIVGKDDQREITIPLAVSMSGTLLPPQLIYAGKINTCHPKFTFPDKWSFTHSVSYWSTKETMLEFIDKVIVSYAADQRQKLKLPATHPALFASHRYKSVCWTSWSSTTFTRYSYLLVVQVNFSRWIWQSTTSEFKSKRKDLFSEWYAAEVQCALSDDVSHATVKVDLRASTIKPLHARWLITAISELSGASCLKLGFEKAGILNCIRK